MKISFVVLTKNEENNLERCLNSLRVYADEILIFDEFSVDKTLEIAKKSGVRVIQNENSRDFAAARNRALEMTRNDFIFFVDADEQLEGGLEDVENLGKDCYRIRRIDMMWGREIEHGENGVWNEIRLMKKGSGEWTGKIHEVFCANGEVGQLENVKLIHYPHQTIKEFLDEINHYSELRAKELHEQGAKSGIWQIMFFPLGKFLLDYIFLLGFLDRARGFVIAAMMSFYSFLTRAKLYLLNKSRYEQD